MANSKVFIIYLMFLVFFNFLAGLYAFENDEAFDIQKYLIVQRARASLAEENSIFSSVLRVVLAPFVLIDVLLFVLVTLSVSFVSIPPLLTTLLFTPLGIIILVDYVLPTVRGN